MSPCFELKWSEPKEITPIETEGHMKGYFINPKNATLGATGCGSIKPFVDDLKRRVHLPLIVKGLGDKQWGYKLASLVLVLVCRPQLGASSIAAVGEKLLSRFISRLFYLRWESKRSSQGKQQETPAHHASVDILYDLFEKLTPERLLVVINNHIKRMRREGKVPKQPDLVVDTRCSSF